MKRSQFDSKPEIGASVVSSEQRLWRTLDKWSKLSNKRRTISTRTDPLYYPKRKMAIGKYKESAKMQANKPFAVRIWCHNSGVVIIKAYRPHGRLPNVLRRGLIFLAFRMDLKAAC